MKTKMLLEILLLVILIVILCGTIWVSFFYHAQVSIPYNLLGSVCFKENCFQVELAKTEVERGQGLMYRKELDKNKGMLFIFDKVGFYPFWMKNTLIPLDMIWIDSSEKVVFISQNVQPCKSLICPSIFPSSQAKYVLEVNAGVCQEIGLKVGDELIISTK